MSYRGTLVALLLVLGLFAGTARAANDTKTEAQNRENSLQNTVAIDSITWGAILERNIEESVDSNVHEMGEARSAREKSLLRWRERQAHLWNALSKDSFVINASAYTAAADECGKSNGITASGVKVLENRTLACPPQYPFGAKIEIDGYGVYVCEDRGGAIKGNHFDIYMETKKEAFAFGRRNLSAKVVD